jgi:sugar lactone lactonase YvrE
MPTPIPLVTGLGGAIGSDFRSVSSRLYFVEYSGKLSCLDLIRPLDAVVSSGTGPLKGTWLFDFDTGAMVSTGAADVWWEQVSTVVRKLVPRGGATIVNLGVVDFNALTHVELQSLTYGTAPIPGNNDPSNQLVVGDVFAVKTNAGNYAKVKVLAYGYDLQLQWVTYRLKPAYRVLGTGYTNPEDIVVSSNEATAYVTERSGTLVRVNLASANRSAAAVVASGLTAPQQVALDEARGFAYVVEYAAAGRLLRVNLSGGAPEVLATGLDRAVGLVMTANGRFAYVSEQTATATNGRITRIDTTSGARDLVAGGLTAPFMMVWNDAGEGGILLAERDPANRVTLIDLTQSPAQVRHLVTGVPARPSSVALVTSDRILVCSDSVVSDVTLTGGVYLPSGPVLMGIGHVPVDRIVAGYADTTGDPGYFFQVKDCPFGGTLPLMINHERARGMGAAYYKILLAGAEVRQSWSDYKWSTATNRFELETITPDAANFYPVRGAGELWYNHWLGCMLSTAGVPTGLRTLEVRLYRPDKSAISLSGLIASVGVMIDNSAPTAKIDQILHSGSPVGTCGIVNSGPDAFRFVITATDPEQHLLSWSLLAYWGDNRSKAVASDSYSAHVSPTRKWAGFSGPVPAGTWASADPSDPVYSHWCAHTFYLRVWDRVINGYNYLHYAEYTKSITIMIPPGP